MQKHLGTNLYQIQLYNDLAINHISVLSMSRSVFKRNISETTQFLWSGRVLPISGYVFNNTGKRTVSKIRIIAYVTHPVIRKLMVKMVTIKLSLRLINTPLIHTYTDYFNLGARWEQVDVLNYTGFLHGLALNPEGGDYVFLRNVGRLSMYCTKLHPGL
jgi:hypothetical protein